MSIYDQAGFTQINANELTHRKIYNFYWSKLNTIFKNQTKQERKMKILEMIQKRLGLTHEDLDKEMNLENLNELQHQLDNVRDEMIAEQERKASEKASKESQEWADNLRKARRSKLSGKTTRDSLKRQARINPARLRKLKAEGKI